MTKPIVAVVGRPNVGKSTFFNKIIGKRISIVEDTPGVTRDRIYAETDWNGVEFALLDTGGIEPASQEIIPAQMRAQAQMAIETSDLVLFVVDAKEGLTHDDFEVADMLRRSQKPVILVVNKVDTGKSDALYDFYELGIGEPIAVSSTNMLGFGDLLDIIVEDLAVVETEDAPDRVGVAVIGRPNVGKSSLINKLLGQDRVIVSPIAGTTRDSIDSPLDDGEDRYMLIDTAGIRRKSKLNENIERYSVLRAIAAIERSDVCVLMIDATEGVTEQDKRIAGYAHEAGKGLVVVVNKWDLFDKETNTMRNYRMQVKGQLVFMKYAPILFTSVINDKRVDKILPTIKAVAENRTTRIPTGKLNSLLSEAMMLKQPPSDKGRRLKIFYVAQVGIEPPLFAFQINDKKLMHFSYARYLENTIREHFHFEGTSIKFLFRERGAADAL